MFHLDTPCLYPALYLFGYNESKPAGKDSMKDFKYLRPTTLEEAILLCTGYVKIIQFIGEAQRPCGSG